MSQMRKLRPEVPELVSGHGVKGTVRTQSQAYSRAHSPVFTAAAYTEQDDWEQARVTGRRPCCVDMMEYSRAVTVKTLFSVLLRNDSLKTVLVKRKQAAE